MLFSNNFEIIILYIDPWIDPRICNWNGRIVRCNTFIIIIFGFLRIMILLRFRDILILSESFSGTRSSLMRNPPAPLRGEGVSDQAKIEAFGYPRRYLS